MKPFTTNPEPPSPPVERLYVAGIRFTVRSSVPVTSLQRPATYAGFVVEPPAWRHDCQCDVSLVSGGLPSLAGLPRLFRCDHYAVFGDAEDRIMALGNAAAGHPEWAARLTRAADRVTVQGLTVQPDGSVDTPLRYPLDQFLVMHALAGQGGGGVIVHGAGLVIQGKGLLLSGRSGAGKTTISRVAMDSGCGLVLGDDRTAVRIFGAAEATSMRMFGTPWAGEAGVARNECASLDALLFLVKAGRCAFRRLSAAEAVAALLPVVSAPWYDRAVLTGVLRTCEEIVTRVPAFAFSFTPDVNALNALNDFAAGCLP